MIGLYRVKVGSRLVKGDLSFPDALFVQRELFEEHGAGQVTIERQRA